MADNRLKNVLWEPGENGRAPTWERVRVALLMDIRDELQQLNRVLACSNFQAIPRKLDMIRRYTSRLRPRPRRKA